MGFTDQDFDRLVGTRIHARRRDARLSLAETCARTGLPRRDMNDIEAGLVRPKASALFALAEVLECGPADFWGGLIDHGTAAPSSRLTGYDQPGRCSRSQRHLDH